MAIKQLSAFVENKPGTLLAMLKALADAGINIRAMSIADTRDFGILRLIVSDIDRAAAVLQHDSIVTATDVLAVEMRDEAGALSGILRALGEANINIEYLYAFTARTERGAYVVFRVDDNEVAERVLQAHHIATLSEAEVAAI